MGVGDEREEALQVVVVRVKWRALRRRRRRGWGEERVRVGRRVRLNRTAMPVLHRNRARGSVCSEIVLVP